jgi:CubicO group peptidase (beta-lactamase class C family)
MELHPGRPDDAGMSAERIQAVRERAQRWVADGVTSALVTVVARHGTIVIHDALGRSGPEADASPTDAATIFPLMSLAKVIAATAVMMLVDDGAIGLQRPVQEYLPEFAGDGKEHVMVHHLLTHTSGLTDDDVVPHREANRGKVTIPPAEPNEDPLLHEMLWLGFDAPLSRAPGAEMSYSGAGYGFLAEILRRVSGQNIGQFARERIFVPLGMRHSYYAIPDDARSRVVKRPPEYSEAERFNDPASSAHPSGSAGGFSTAMDMAIFCQMFLNHGGHGGVRILSPVAVREMTRNQIPGVPSRFKEDVEREASRGYGWDVKGIKKPRYHGSLDSPAAFTHQGAGGVSIMCDPTYDLVIVFFSTARGIMSPDRYRPEWPMDVFTNMVIASIIDA